MQNVSTLPNLLKLANVSALTVDTIPEILKAITDNKIRLEGDALIQLTSLLKSVPSAVTATYKSIQKATQKANKNNDKQSLKYIGGLLGLLKSSGISDERIDSLIEQIENHEHEIRMERTKGFFSLAKIALVGGLAILGVATHNKTQKRNLWEK